MANLPYVTSPGNIDRALSAIQSAATPERITQDFVKTILKIPGGSGDQMTSFLKKTGFANTDGSPSPIYHQFRNPSTAGSAAAQALRIGYQPLYRRNEYMHELTDEKLKGLIIEETGQKKDSNVVKLVFASIKAIKKFADWAAPTEELKSAPDIKSDVATVERVSMRERTESVRVGMNLSYTINLNLPATTDVAVFNAIFKSLKENLLRNE